MKILLALYAKHLPVFPVFFIHVLFEDSASNPSRMSSRFSGTTLVFWSMMSMGDWLIPLHSAFNETQCSGP